MTGPRVEIEIGELVVDGLDPGAREVLAGAVRRRLGELVAERGLPDAATGGSASQTVTVDLKEPAGRRADLLGAELAEAIYRGLAR